MMLSLSTASQLSGNSVSKSILIVKNPLQRSYGDFTVFDIRIDNHIGDGRQQVLPRVCRGDVPNIVRAGFAHIREYAVDLCRVVGIRDAATDEFADKIGTRGQFGVLAAHKKNFAPQNRSGIQAAYALKAKQDNIAVRTDG
ncbi:hypothetical protein SDC9_191249 [bioreactor metagenome]|uniref:Uncharacterized protein n=1 Tax=bioreactor metagenome TaxID=1076179 RepID=A0A645HZS7_9ZZZZ